MINENLFTVLLISYIQIPNDVQKIVWIDY